MSSTVTISQLQARTPKVVRDTERRGYTAVTRHGQMVAVLMSKDRIEAMLETMELQNNQQFMKVFKQFKAGSLKFRPVPENESQG